MAYLAITDPEIANGAVITQTLMHKNRDNLQAVCDDDVTIPPANTLKRMGRQNVILIGNANIAGSTAKLQLVGPLDATGQVSSISAYLGELLGANPQPKNIGLGYNALSTNKWSLFAQHYGIGFTTLSVNELGGAVTIGTDPGGSELLRVGGSISAGSNGLKSRYFDFTPQASVNTFQLSTDISAGGFFVYDSTASQYRFIVKNNGNVTIGTDPGGSELLRVGGGIRANGDSVIARADNSEAFKVQGTTGRLIFWGYRGVGASIAAFDAAQSSTIPLYFQASRINVDGPFLVGTDPGGAALLRVGGDVSIKVPMTWPNANATGFLKNNGSGALSWDASGPSATFNTLITANNGIYANATNGDLRVSASTSYARGFYSETSDVRRWFCGTPSGPAESGGNNGSNFQVVRFDDAGAVINAPLTISRLTGTVTVASLSSPNFTTNGNKMTTATVVPPSFADLAAVRTWLAAQFT